MPDWVLGTEAYGGAGAWPLTNGKAVMEAMLSAVAYGYDGVTPRFASW